MAHISIKHSVYPNKTEKASFANWAKHAKALGGKPVGKDKVGHHHVMYEVSEELKMQLLLTDSVFEDGDALIAKYKLIEQSIANDDADGSWALLMSS